jgi:hypothetical protein
VAGKLKKARQHPGAKQPPTGNAFLECGGRRKSDVLSGLSGDAAFNPRGAEPKGTLAGKLHHAFTGHIPSRPRSAENQSCVAAR